MFSPGEPRTVVLDASHPAVHRQRKVVIGQVAAPDDERALRALDAHHFTSAATFASWVPHGVVDSVGGIVGTAEGTWFTDAVRTISILDRLGVEHDEAWAVDLPEPTAHIDGTLVPLLGTTDANYFHWMFESLARLGVYRRCAVAGPVRFAVRKLSSVQRDFLRLAGVEDEQLLVVDEGSLSADQVLFCSRGMSSIVNLSHPAIRFLTSLRAVALGDREMTAPSDRIYISRRSARRRRILNEPDVEAVLRQHGFMILETELLSAREQIQIFAGAQSVLGVHGAGLTNILFAPTGCDVIELAPEGQDLSGATLYRGLASACGHTYASLVCREEGRDVVVDLDALHDALTL